MFMVHIVQFGGVTEIQRFYDFPDLAGKYLFTPLL